MPTMHRMTILHPLYCILDIFHIWLLSPGGSIGVGGKIRFSFGSLLAMSASPDLTLEMSAISGTKSSVDLRSYCE